MKRTFFWLIGAVCVVGSALALIWGTGLLGRPPRVQVIHAGQNFTIPLSEVNGIPKFFPLEIDGTKMEVIAVKDSLGNVRTAFNTCQSCYASGKGYYEVEGNKLICQNCGAQFTAEQVETSVGGCNPLPIFAENKIVSDRMLRIPYDYLKDVAVLFSNWKP